MNNNTRTDRQMLKDNVWSNVYSEILKLSHDENTKVGAIIISESGRVLSAGYNGASAGLNDDEIPYGREPKELTFYVNGNETKINVNKHPFMIHAERNAIEECPRPEELKGATIYVSHKPCADCAHLIARKGIKRVVVAEDDSNSTSSSVGKNWELSLFFFASHGVEVWVGDEETKLSMTLSSRTRYEMQENERRKQNAENISLGDCESKIIGGYSSTINQNQTGTSILSGTSFDQRLGS